MLALVFSTLRACGPPVKRVIAVCRASAVRPGLDSAPMRRSARTRLQRRRCRSLAAACGSAEDTTTATGPRPSSGRWRRQSTTRQVAVPEGDAGGRQGGLHVGGLRRVPRAGRRGYDRHRRARTSTRSQPEPRARASSSPERRRRDAAVPGQLTEQQIADVTAYVVQADRRLARPAAPGDFPRDVEVFACDLDRTLIAEDLRTPRPHARGDRGARRGRASR